LKPHIVLIVHDSVRAESTSLFGRVAGATPIQDRLAEESVAYTNAISTCVSTVPAHGSLFTGTYPSTHDLYVDGEALQPSFSTLAEALTAHGYRSFGVCYQDDVSPVTGLHRGFQQFDMDDEPGFVRHVIRNVVKTKNVIGPTPEQLKPSPPHATKLPSAARGWKDSRAYKKLLWTASSRSDQGAGATARKARRFLSTVRSDEPVFMYLHYDEAHLPYRPPVPYRYRFVPAHLRHRAAYVNQNRNRFFTGEAVMTHEDFEVLRGLYHGAIAFLDSTVTSVYELLRERRMLDETMLIVMGDHGDNIGEHGLLSHKFCVYDTLTRVPLVIRYPKGVLRAGPEHAIVQHTDLVPTVLDLAGVPESALPQALEGNSLVSNRIRHRKEELAISELLKPFGRESAHLRVRMQRYDRLFFSVRSRTHKYIWASDGRHEFYDVVRDPSEERDLAASNAGDPMFQSLRAAAERHLPAFQASLERTQARV
jgi:arylsulfatase A-like enzyme